MRPLQSKLDTAQKYVKASKNEVKNRKRQDGWLDALFKRFGNKNLLDDLLGRTTATFRTRTGALVHGGYFTQQFYDIEGVSQFQIIQESLKHCVLKLVINKHWTETSRRYLVQSIQRILGRDVVVTVEFVKDIPLPTSGKRGFTISKVTAPTD